MERIVFYSENRTKSINTLCRHNSVLLNVKVGGTHSHHCVLGEASQTRGPLRGFVGPISVLEL